MDNELNLEATTPTEEAETVQEAEADTESTPTEGINAEAEGTANTAEGESAPPEQELFKIRYKHEDLDISVDEAKRLAQMGKHYEDNVKSTLDSLDYVATLRGKSVKELVDELRSGVDSSYREELIAQFGEDNPIVDEMMELRQAKNDKAYDKAKSDRAAKEQQAEEEAQKSVTARLAEQFESIREIFPEYDTAEKVPEAVIKRAIKSGDLEKELLRFKLTEQKKIEAAKASQEKNKKENIGSVASDKAEDNVASAFMRGIWS